MYPKEDIKSIGKALAQLKKQKPSTDLLADFY